MLAMNGSIRTSSHSRRAYRSLLVLALLGFHGPTARGAAPGQIAFTHATVIDATGAPPARDATVVVVGARITAVGPSGRVTVPKGARVIDATGKYLIPGLWDMHVHVFSHEVHPGTDLSAWAFPLFVANGVTGVRDMWTDPQDMIVVRRWNAALDAGRLVGPRVEWSSSIVDGEPGRSSKVLIVRTPDEGRRAVRDQQVAGARFIKVYSDLKRDVFMAIADESRKRHIPFAGHVPAAVNAFDASDAGMKSFEHLLGIAETCSSRSKEWFALPPDKWTPQLRAAMRDSYDEATCAALFARLAKNGTWQVPTLIIRESVQLAQEAGISSNPALAYVPAEDVDAWKAPPGRVSLEIRRARFAQLLHIVGAMQRSGVGILAGTDLGNPFMIPGFSLHDELALMVDAGLTPLEALQTATRNAGRYFGRTDIGTVTRGSTADLVLLDVDPLADIHNTRRIFGVVVNGRYFTRGDLDRMLADRRR